MRRAILISFAILFLTIPAVARASVLLPGLLDVAALRGATLVSCDAVTPPSHLGLWLSACVTATASGVRKDALAYEADLRSKGWRFSGERLDFRYFEKPDGAGLCYKAVISAYKGEGVVGLWYRASRRCETEAIGK